MAAVTTEPARPPDVRGPTAPLPLGVFATGIGALVAVVIGTAAVQVGYAIRGGGLTAPCRTAGLTRKITGSQGVCHIVEAARSDLATLLVAVGMGLGAVAIAVGFSIYRRMDSKRKREHAVAGAVLGIQAVVLSGALLWFRSSHLFLTFVKDFLNFTLLKGQVGSFVTGAKNTLLLALGGEAGGIALGLVLAMFVVSSRRVVRAPARAYVNFFRGTPLIWQLSFFYFGISLGLGVNLGTYKTAILVFALNTGAYAAEVFRAGIQSIERGQLEAARGLGLSYIQAMRHVIVPQAVRRVIPPLMNEFVILIKDTALIIIIGVTLAQRELFITATDGYSETFNATFFVAAAIGYLVVTLPLIRLVNAVERRLRSGLVGVAGGFGN
jgi:polar amino acid transport system permease protein